MSREYFVFWLESFRNGDINDEGYRQKIADTLLKEVRVYDEPNGQRLYELTYNLSENNVSIAEKFDSPGKTRSDSDSLVEARRIELRSILAP